MEQSLLGLIPFCHDGLIGHGRLFEAFDQHVGGLRLLEERQELKAAFPDYDANIADCDKKVWQRNGEEGGKVGSRLLCPSIPMAPALLPPTYSLS